ncbi:hypothetical protein M3J09_008223 [Ascochyta lentis]
MFAKFGFPENAGGLEEEVEDKDRNPNITTWFSIYCTLSKWFGKYEADSNGIL